MAVDRRRRRNQPLSQINVVPYIDVMLVLLIIFMVTAPLLKQGVEVDLPDAPSKPLAEDRQTPERLLVTVDRQGRYYVTDHENTAPVPAEALGDTVRAALSEEPKRPVYVQGDTEVGYGRVITAMVELQQAGVDGVGLITEPPQKPAGDR